MFQRETHPTPLPRQVAALGPAAADGGVWTTHSFRNQITRGVPPFVEARVKASAAILAQPAHPTTATLREAVQQLRSEAEAAHGTPGTSVVVARDDTPLQISLGSLASSGVLPPAALGVAAEQMFAVGDDMGAESVVLRPVLTGQLYDEVVRAQRSGALGGADAAAVVVSGAVCRREQYITAMTSPVTHEVEAVVVPPDSASLVRPLPSTRRRVAPGLTHDAYAPPPPPSGRVRRGDRVG